MGESGRTENQRGYRLRSGLLTFRVEGSGSILRRFDLDPHREISSILDHLN